MLRGDVKEFVASLTQEAAYKKYIETSIADTLDDVDVSLSTIQWNKALLEQLEAVLSKEEICRALVEIYSKLKKPQWYCSGKAFEFDGNFQITAQFVGEVGFVDPKTKGEVPLEVFIDPISKGMFAIDASYTDQVSDTIVSPFNKDVTLLLEVPDGPTRIAGTDIKVIELLADSQNRQPVRQVEFRPRVVKSRRQEPEDIHQAHDDQARRQPTHYLGAALGESGEQQQEGHREVEDNQDQPHPGPTTPRTAHVPGNFLPQVSAPDDEELGSGGATETEVKERKDRVDDAMHATRAAVEEGIMPGGGVALLRAGKAIEKLRGKNEDQRHGIEIVKKAIGWPARQIAMNAGEDGSVVVGKILEHDTYAYGYDAQISPTLRLRGPCCARCPAPCARRIPGSWYSGPATWSWRSPRPVCASLCRLCCGSAPPIP